MRVRVLGSAAGGGFPQWNCNCRNCAGVRARTIRASARTQSSIALSVDGQNWLLCNASPDLPVQIRAFGALQPGRALRDSGISDVLLVDAQIDHVLGLLTLREGKPLRIWCTELVRQELSTSLPIFPLLGHYSGVEWLRVPIEEDSRFFMPSLGAVECRALPMAGNAPPFSARRDGPALGDNIGLCFTNPSSGRTLFYAPGLGAVEPALEARLRQADILLVDGTFWSEDELIRLGVSRRTARQMGHLPQSGPGGMLELSRRLNGRKILIHVNNTNPILDEDSPERAELQAAGVEVAYDGMEIDL